MTYFSTIDALYHHWESIISTPTGSFITDNKKELIEVILGTRGYRIETPLYYALVKGHGLVYDNAKYWVYDTWSQGDIFVGHRVQLHSRYRVKFGKSEWKDIGIDDTNADFVKVDE